MSHPIITTPVDTLVRIQHPDHPYDGLIVQVLEFGPATGGTGGGGHVYVRLFDSRGRGYRDTVSRYTRVTEV